MANYRRELRMEADIRKKEKVEKSDGVCRENEESIERGRGSIEKDAERYEEAS